MKSRSSWSDEQIIQAIHGGGAAREKAVDYMIRQYAGFAIKFSRKFNLDDEKIQDAYMDAILALLQQVKAGQFKGASKLSSYFYQIFYFKCVDVTRKNTTQVVDIEEALINEEDPARNALETLEIDESMSQVMAGLNKLGEPCKQILMEWGFWGYKISEIAKRLEEEPNKIMKRKYKCLQRLRKQLQERVN